VKNQSKDITLILKHIIKKLISSIYFFKDLRVCHEITITFMHLSFRPSLTDPHSQKTAQLSLKNQEQTKTKKSSQSCKFRLKKRGFWLSLESLIDEGKK